MNKFLKKLAVRLLIFFAVMLGVFLLKLPREYYFEIPKYTDYSKISWIENKLNSINNLDSSIIFVGSSICFNGINDSLLNSLDSTATDYYNFGLSHTCYSIIDATLNNIVVERKMHPKKVILCFKGDAMARNIHKMYPLVASTDHILKSGIDGNMLFVPSFLRRTSWNVHYVSSHFKLDEGNPDLEFKSKYGYEPQKFIDSTEVERSYKELKAGSEANFSAIEKAIQGGPEGLKTKLVHAKGDYFENIKYQRKSFENTAALLDKYNIDYDILVYPNIVSARMDKTKLMSEYVKYTFKNIDYQKHKLITADDPAFKKSSLYTDSNHLNPDGAKKLTELVYTFLQNNK